MNTIIRQLEVSDLPALKDLTDTAGWNCSEEFLQFCLDTDPQGMLLAEDKDGKLIS